MTSKPQRDPRPSASRRVFGARLRPAFNKYTSLVGEVTWASNNLHSMFFTLIGTIFPSVGPNDLLLSDNVDMAEEIWHSLRSDDMQRAAIRAVAKYSSRLTTLQRRNLLWAIDAAGRLSEYRNDAIHTPFDLTDGSLDNARRAKFEPTVGHPKRVEKLRRVGHVKLFKALVGDLNQLNFYVEALWLNSLFSREGKKPPALPKRPVLRSVLLVQKSPPKTPLPTQHPPKRKRQRPPSRAK